MAETLRDAEGQGMPDVDGLVNIMGNMGFMPPRELMLMPPKLLDALSRGHLNGKVRRSVVMGIVADQHREGPVGNSNLSMIIMATSGAILTSDEKTTSRVRKDLLTYQGAYRVNAKTKKEQDTEDAQVSQGS